MQLPFIYVIAALALPALASCRNKPAESPPPTLVTPIAPATAAAPPPAPTAAPKCESVEERCQALSETQVEIGGGGAWFRPPASWFYAKEPTVAVGFSPDSFAALAFARAASADPDAVVAALEQLFVRLEITKLKAQSLKPRLKKPDSTVPIEGSELKLWEIDQTKAGQGPELRGKRGTLLVALASFGEQAIVALGFVVKPEGAAQAPAIMDSVQSLRGAK